ESTDVGNKRLLRILIKYVYNFKIKTQLLDLEAIGADEGTARGLYNLLKACFLDFKINTQQIIGFCSDNASVMVGVKESVKAHLLSENPALIGNSCICHTVHLIAVDAAKMIPESVENLLQQLSSYFSRSPKRQSILEEFQQFMQSERLKVHKPSQTRWLALSRCVDRVLLMWDVLIELFKVADFEEKNVSSLIYNDMCNPVNKAYLLFFKYILPEFNKFNAFFSVRKIINT
ncbi:unnamed protein product, partial [Tenebrio molitor]